MKQSEQLVQSLNERDLLSRNLYCLETINALEDTPPELTIYLLKQLVIEASLANHNLQRILAVNRWRQVMEYGKSKIKSVQCKLMEGTIKTLDQVLERSRKTHDKIRERMDKLESHIYDNRNHYGDLVLLTEGGAGPSNTTNQAANNLKNQLMDGKAIIGFNSLKDKVQNLCNQSTLQMNMSSSQHYQNNYTTVSQGGTKSRFVRTITNKTLGKVFNFIERSPISRGSICGGPAVANNQSIISQYYGQRQKHHSQYRQGGGTPHRTGGMSSPVYNFQSPIRKQHPHQQTFVYATVTNNILPQNCACNLDNPVVQQSSTIPHSTQLQLKQQQLLAQSKQQECQNQMSSQQVSNFQLLPNSLLHQTSNLLIYSNDSASGEQSQVDVSKQPRLTRDLLESQDLQKKDSKIKLNKQIGEAGMATGANTTNDSLSQQFTFQNNTQLPINQQQPIFGQPITDGQQQVHLQILSQQNSNNNILLLSNSSTANQLLVGTTTNFLGSGRNSNNNFNGTSNGMIGGANTTCLINNEQMNFEDAIAKFFNSSELEGKNAQRIKGLTSDSKGVDDLRNGGGGIKLNHDDLLKIENFNSLQEIKDFLRGKFERNPSVTHIEQLQNSASVHLNPLFAQYQTNAAYRDQHNYNNHSSNLQNSQVENNPQINSHTTNNNLYAQSNDFYDNGDPSGSKGMPCSSSGHYHDNQRQEHVMTLASEYMITGNSVIGPSGLFGGNGTTQVGDRGNYGYYHQNDYLDRLQEKIVQLQEEVDTQKCRAEEHKKAYYESKKQIEQMRDLMEDKESKHNLILKSEICQWERALTKFKEMNESELLKKQKEIEQLHEVLAQWMENYQQLQTSKGPQGLTQSISSLPQGSNQKLETLIQEQEIAGLHFFRTMKHRRQRSGLLSEVMKSPAHRRRLSGNQPPSTLSLDPRLPQPHRINNNGGSYSKSNYKMHPQMLNPGLMNPNINPTSMFDKKKINGDNSPVAQEDSCYDIDNQYLIHNQSLLLQQQYRNQQSHNLNSSSILMLSQSNNHGMSREELGNGSSQDSQFDQSQQQQEKSESFPIHTSNSFI